MAPTLLTRTAAPDGSPSRRALGHKLTPPAAQPGQLERPSLCERICRAEGQLVLVTAPAGFGKTTAMRQAHDRLRLAAGITCMWLTLDTTANDSSRFMASLDAALLQAGLLADAPNAPGDPAPGDPIRTLMDLTRPFALFLDELEVLAEPAVLALIRELAIHLPPQGRLVIGSRKLPALGLGRLRVRGQLTEIDAEQLRFEPQETRALFDHLGWPAGLDARHADTLHDKTEGWIAALRLAQRALARAADPLEFIERFSGSNRAVADYLAEDVLAQQPPRLRRFLLRTSILRQLDVSVCTALNPNEDCTILLDQLDEQQLFLMPVDSDGRVWRYHRLFADFLRNHLAREHPTEVERLHLAASGWYEDQGRPIPAIAHAIEGGDLPHALSLIARHAEEFLEQGRMRLLARWFAAIPGSMLREHPRLEMVAIWAICLTRGPWEAMARLDAREAGLRDASYRIHATSMRPMFLAMQDRYDDALAAGREALPGLSGPNGLPGLSGPNGLPELALPQGEPFANATLLNALAHVGSVFFAPAQVWPLLRASRQLQGSRSNFNRMYTEAIEGMLDLMQGRLRQATERFRAGLDATHAVNRHHSHGNAWAGVLYAQALYEADELGRAEHLLNVYLPLARDVGLPDHMILSHAMRARLAQWHGDVDVAMQTLNDLETLGHQRQMPRVVAAAQLERAHLSMTRGQRTQSAAQLLQAEDDALWARERRQLLIANETQYLRLAQLRWQLAFGEGDALAAASDGLREEITLATQGGRQRRLLVLQALLASALDRLGRWAEAVPLLHTALATAAQEGHVRLLIDEGPAVIRTLRRLQADGAAPIASQPAIAAHLERLLRAARPVWTLCENQAIEATEPMELPPAAPGDEASPAKAAPGDALTQREQQVLELLALGYSNSAMAEKLFLSDSTVRTHLRSINAKMGARSRTHAVALARQAGLVQ